MNTRMAMAGSGYAVMKDGELMERLQEQQEEKDSVVHKTTNWCPQWTLADAPNFKVQSLLYLMAQEDEVSTKTLVSTVGSMRPTPL